MDKLHITYLLEVNFIAQCQIYVDGLMLARKLFGSFVGPRTHKATRMAGLIAVRHLQLE
jgi:hypothetical protein